MVGEHPLDSVRTDFHVAMVGRVHIRRAPPAADDLRAPPSRASILHVLRATSSALPPSGPATSDVVERPIPESAGYHHVLAPREPPSRANRVHSRGPHLALPVSHRRPRRRARRSAGPARGGVPASASSASRVSKRAATSSISRSPSSGIPISLQRQVCAAGLSTFFMSSLATSATFCICDRSWLFFDSSSRKSRARCAAEASSFSS